MLKQLCVSLFACAFMTSAYALQLNVTPAADFTQNQNTTNVSLDIMKGTFPNFSHEYHGGKGLAYAYFSQYFNLLSKLYADVHPSDNVKVALTLGYKKNGLEVYPDSCKDIKLAEVTNIVFGETGCVVS